MRRGILALLFLAGLVVLTGAMVSRTLAVPRSAQEENESIVYRGVTACGVERWSIKTGTDRDAHLVNLKAPTPTNIIHLRSLPAPADLPLGSRIRPVETTAYSESAILLRYKMENDSDFHLVLSDTGGRTMIAEIPAPECVGSNSPFLAAIRSTRRSFESRFHPTQFWQRVHLPMQIAGVGFFDFLHGQSGVAPNGIELHPVLSYRFGGSGPVSPPAPPVATQVPVPVGHAQVSANVSDSSPPRYTRVTVFGRLRGAKGPVRGASMQAAWHFKTGTGYCSAISDSSGTASCSRYIGRATRGYTVRIDVSFTYGGRTYSTSTSFTPH